MAASPKTVGQLSQSPSSYSAAGKRAKTKRSISLTAIVACSVTRGAVDFGISLLVPLSENRGSMAEEPENHTIRLLQEMRAEMREGFAGVNQRFDKLEANIAASDAENAKVLETITHDIADLKTIFVDVQARVIRDERRIKALEKTRPEA
jgi:hypothetical protein